MEIYKILNNNVIVSKNEHDKEIIAMGKGIAFKKKVGEHIEDELIDKVYTLSDEVSSKFQELAAEIPVEHMKISDDIIKYVKLKLGKKLNDSIYLSLCDHISTAILRHEEGVDVKNVLLWDIKKFYKDEFEIGKHGLEMIKEKLNVQLNEDEAGFIALHIVNAEMDEKLETIYEVTKVMQEILNIVKYFFHIDFDEDSVYFYRFITHLKFFAHRLITKSSYQDEQSDDLLELIKIKYKNAYACCLKIKQFLKTNYAYDLSQEETLYLTIHIARVVYKNERS
ncbi:BglG family transcription antiterminator LicT [Amedibacterium intestinale]|uniref:BglG family transcription antiterminator LicT n=1 Tax=Amedibacterium intestinale TaxID=2583452 RepID=UPI000E4AD220|nr:PRD domain-containing protein [Amedibacterium intestinale]RHO20964.1 PRD domain-containing protein [Eubacterium sp. AM18-26]RHO25082.1 PRD domain-containing protein [Eubacterium sp. AM18-10LB-B]